MGEFPTPEMGRMDEFEMGQEIKSPAISPDKISKTFESAERAQLFGILNNIYQSGLTQDQKQDKLSQLDDVAEPFIEGEKLSKFQYVFPKDLPYFNEKANYTCDLANDELNFTNIPSHYLLQVCPGDKFFTAGSHGADMYFEENGYRGRQGFEHITPLPLHGLLVLSDGSVITANGTADLRIYRRSKFGKWEKNEFYSGTMPIRDVSLLPGGIILLNEGQNLGFLTQEGSGEFGNEAGCFLSTADGEYERTQPLPDGRILCTTTAGCVFVASLDKNGLWQTELVGKHINVQESCIHMLPDGRIISGSDGGSIRVWTRGGIGEWKWTPQEAFDNSYFTITCLQALPDGRFMALLRALDGRKTSLVSIFEENTDGVWVKKDLVKSNIAFLNAQALPDGRIVTLSTVAINIWDQNSNWEAINA